MTIFHIPDPERFLHLAEKSRGSVMLHLPDGSQVDLRENHDARQLLRMLQPGRAGLRISLSDSEDAPDFLRYMMECGAGG